MIDTERKKPGRKRSEPATEGGRLFGLWMSESEDERRSCLLSMGLTESYINMLRRGERRPGMELGVWLQENAGIPIQTWLTVHSEDAARHISRKVKPDDCCAACGSTENLQRHHLDYSAPFSIDTLCAKCHGRVHRNGKGVARGGGDKRRGPKPAAPKSEGGRRLRVILNDRAQAEALSRATGVSLSQLHRLASGTCLPTLPVALELDRAAGIEPKAWFFEPTTAT